MSARGRHQFINYPGRYMTFDLLTFLRANHITIGTQYTTRVKAGNFKIAPSFGHFQYFLSSFVTISIFFRMSQYTISRGIFNIEVLNWAHLQHR